MDAAIARHPDSQRKAVVPLKSAAPGDQLRQRVDERLAALEQTDAGKRLRALMLSPARRDGWARLLKRVFDVGPDKHVRAKNEKNEKAGRLCTVPASKMVASRNQTPAANPHECLLRLWDGRNMPPNVPPKHGNPT
jgi:hypothetical protein